MNGLFRDFLLRLGKKDKHCWWWASLTSIIKVKKNPLNVYFYKLYRAFTKNTSNVRKWTYPLRKKSNLVVFHSNIKTKTVNHHTTHICSSKSKYAQSPEPYAPWYLFVSHSKFGLTVNCGLARWYAFLHTKNPNFGILWKALVWKMVYCIAIGYT
jgi:hypothetical protein